MAGVLLFDRTGVRVPLEILLPNTPPFPYGRAFWAAVGKFVTGVSKAIDIKAAGLNHFTWMLEVRDGRTGEDLYPLLRKRLLAIGSAVETARDLLDLPIERALPQAPPRFGPGAGRQTEAREDGTAVLREAFSSPARLMQTLRDRVAEPESLFYCPGSLLNNEFDPTHPVAWGMPAAWSVFFDDDQAYRLRPGFGVDAKVVSRYPREKVLASGWLLGEEYLKDQANILSFKIGKGNVVTYGSQIDFRAQPRATWKLIFNGIFHGPSTPVPAAQMGRATTAATNDQR